MKRHLKLAIALLFIASGSVIWEAETSIAQHSD